MSDKSTMKIRGIPELLRKLKDPRWKNRAIREMMTDWALTTQRYTVANMSKPGREGWKDSGESRRSVANEVDHAESPQYARVGSNLDKFRWGELGTGEWSDDPASSHRAYFPPASALDAWAVKHGFASGWQVAYIIYRSGGTKPRKMLRDAADKSQGQMHSILTRAARRMEGYARAA